MIHIGEWEAVAPAMFNDALKVLPTMRRFAEQDVEPYMDTAWATFQIDDREATRYSSNDLAYMFLRPAVLGMAEVVEQKVMEKLIGDLVSLNRTPILPRLTPDNAQDEVEHALRILNNHNASRQRFLWSSMTVDRATLPLGPRPFGFTSDTLPPLVGNTINGWALAWDKEALSYQYDFDMRIIESTARNGFRTEVRVTATPAAWVVIPNWVIIFRD